eukprot:SAG11_NODE_2307_length_3546_cov_2.779809_1_plen_93_part_00
MFTSPAVGTIMSAVFLGGARAGKRRWHVCSDGAVHHSLAQLSGDAERISLVQAVALCATMIGTVLVVRPEFLFPADATAGAANGGGYGDDQV